jgi:hypothetical protein
VLLSALVLVPVLVGAPDAGGGEPPPLTCGDSITSDVVLTVDLACEGTALTVDGSNLTVDLGGHTVSRTVPPELDVGFDPAVIAVFGDGVTVQNGEVVGTGRGSGSALTAYGVGSRLHDLQVRSGDVWLLGASRLQASRVTNGDVYVAGSGAVVADNLVRRGTIEVESTEASVRDFVIAFNTVQDSRRAGITACPFFFALDDVRGTIALNQVLRSRGAGIELRCDLQAIGALQIAYNLVAENDGDGMFIVGDLVTEPPTPDSGGPVTLTGNQAVSNAGQGIFAPWVRGVPSAIVDGGGNRALLNGETPVCVGVRCIRR